MIEEAALRQLYLEEKLSAKQIADQLQVAEAKVVYWLRKYSVANVRLHDQMNIWLEELYEHLT